MLEGLDHGEGHVLESRTILHVGLFLPFVLFLLLLLFSLLSFLSDQFILIVSLIPIICNSKLFFLLELKDGSEVLVDRSEAAVRGSLNLH